jgi:hypothetical protein
MKNLIKSTARRLGYDIRRLEAVSPPSRSSSFTLFQYQKPDGSFDYDSYRRIQEEGNKRKINQVWVLEANIQLLSEYLAANLKPVQFGICHGTRRGNEQLWFRKYLGCEVIGTEISETAKDFPHTVQWDFHQPNPEWTGKTDFIYSNSFDHSYAPESCLDTWMNTLRPGGLCILEHTNLHAPEGANELDPFGAELEIMPFLITKWAKGNYFVREIIEASERPAGVRSINFIVIERR